ncbi:MAG TPA: putative glycolipid-binding domain-containing protein [Mycobacterium sp.]|nr:putative glycolipid-binding domain-containing protein [Mycobacterium sp.]
MSEAPPDPAPDAWPAILTWRAPDTSRMESVRVQLSGNRIRALGRLVAAASESYPAFSVYYDLLTDDSGATRRLGLQVSLAERERQLSIARDEENMWLVTDTRSESRAGYDGALDVDVLFSPFFNTLPIRRAGLHERAGSITVPTVYVRLPDLTVTAGPTSYRSAGPDREAGITVRSPAAEATVTVDADGFIVNYPGLAERI